MMSKREIKKCVLEITDCLYDRVGLELDLVIGGIL